MGYYSVPYCTVVASRCYCFFYNSEPFLFSFGSHLKRTIGVQFKLIKGVVPKSLSSMEEMMKIYSIYFSFFPFERSIETTFQFYNFVCLSLLLIASDSYCMGVATTTLSTCPLSRRMVTLFCPVYHYHWEFVLVFKLC